MFLVLLMIFDPAGGWGRAAESGRSVMRVLFLHLLPMLLLGCVAEGAGMLRWGKQAGKFGAMKQFVPDEVIRYQACYFVVALVVVLLCAFFIKFLGNTFHARQKFVEALTVSVFGLGPIFLLRLLDALPAMSPWLPWGLGAVLGAALLYQGVPRVMRLDPAHAMGVYVCSALLLVLTSGAGRLLVVFLQGRMMV
jgi:uncharacterized membrane protein